MIYLFPSAGLGSRLVNSGIKPPKPLVQVHGHELLLWSISSFTYKGNDSIVVVTLRSDNVKSLISEKLSSLYPTQNIFWIELDSLSSGQLDTCIIALSKLKSIGIPDQPLVIHNCDSSFDGAFLADFYSDSSFSGFIPYFNSLGDHWSFLEFDSSSSISRIVEKNRISNHCSIGTYSFISYLTFLSLYEDYVGSVEIKGENYVAPFLDFLLSCNYTFKAVPAPSPRIYGTLAEVLDAFSISFNVLIGENSASAHQRRTFIFDIDKTISGPPSSCGDYSQCVPIDSVIDKLRLLSSSGAYIILFTARNIRTFKGNIGLINKYTAPVLLSWLSKYEIPYDEIYFGKPWGRNPLYIDDLALNPDSFVNSPFL